MISCLENFIGLSASCGPASKSLMYVEDYPGISLKSLSAIESGKYLTVERLIAEKTRIAGEKIIGRMSELLGDLFIEESVESLIGKGFCEDVVANAAGNPGLRITKKSTVLTHLYIPRFYFKSLTEVNDLDITITDGVITTTHTISALADEEVVIEAAFQTNQLKVNITYNSAGGPSDIPVVPYQGSVKPYDKYYCHTCGGSKGLNHIYVKGLDYDGVEGNDYYGIRADVELVCDIEKMLCLIAGQKKNKTLFFYAIMAEILPEGYSTDRLNPYTLNTRDWYVAEHQKCMQMFDELWFSNSKAFRNFLKGIERECFVCTGAQSRYSLP